jgi:hypothetical protein
MEVFPIASSHRLRLVREKKIFWCPIGCVGKMLRGVFGY